MLRCIYGCQKWIPDKILHRNSDSIFFLNFFFDNKKNILKMKKYFQKNIEIFSKEKLKIFHFALKIFSMQKSIFQNFPLKNFRFFSKIFFHFQNVFFVIEKKSWEKNRITISMQNFVRNPFLASINSTDNSGQDFWLCVFFPSTCNEQHPHLMNQHDVLRAIYQLYNVLKSLFKVTV